jgi:hypothetical protein
MPLIDHGDSVPRAQEPLKRLLRDHTLTSSLFKFLLNAHIIPATSRFLKPCLPFKISDHNFVCVSNLLFENYSSPIIFSKHTLIYQYVTQKLCTEIEEN